MLFERTYTINSTNLCRAIVKKLYKMYTFGEILPKVEFWLSQGKSEKWITAYLMRYLVGDTILSKSEIEFCNRVLQNNR